MSDSIMSECLFAAICHVAATYNRILVEKFSLCCRTKSASDVVGQYNKTGGITFGAAAVYLLELYKNVISLHFEQSSLKYTEVSLGKHSMEGSSRDYYAITDTIKVSVIL